MSLKTALGSTSRGKSNKLVLGFAALAATAIIGTTGIAAAQTGSAQMSSGYGGNTANVSIDLDVSGDNNVVNFVLNLFR
ncbi:MAG TPA: hypothetical protein VD735_02585 [Candidatus Saccharimonadales bacterium]|nr:hypothetical protein [Candidatus Saccharimonadales bacterium]